MASSHALVLSAVLAAVAGPAAVSLAGAPADPDGLLLVVAAPWIGAEAVVTRAGGQLKGVRQPLVGVVAAGDGADFPDRLRREGAWLVLADARLLFLCGVES